MKKLKLLLLSLTLVLGMVPFSVYAATPSAASVGALWDSYTTNNTTFAFRNSSRVVVLADTEPTGELLQTTELIHRQFCTQCDWELEFKWTSDKSLIESGDIVLSIESAISNEGYVLEVTDYAMIKASDMRGLIYGANNLLKCIRNAGTTITGFTAADTPDIKERTVQLDVARKYFTKEWILNFIKQMSWMGYNTLSLHFSEDGGFRADLWDHAYYVDGEFEPENDFTWLCGSHVQTWVKDPYRTDPDAGKYLTTAELVEICEVAKEYQIDIIPSFDSPAHMDYITWKYEQHYLDDKDFHYLYDGKVYYAKNSNGCINYNGTTGGMSPIWPYYTTMDIRSGYIRSDNAIAFVYSIYKDIADFFKVYAGSTKFSVGADEVNLAAAENSWGYSRFPTYINNLNNLLRERGYTVRMFNDFIKDLCQFDDNIEILYWDAPNNSSSSIMKVSSFTDDNRTLYNCIQTHCYFVLRTTSGLTTEDGDMYDARSSSCRTWTFYRSMEDTIYNEWSPANIKEYNNSYQGSGNVPANQIGGAYFLLWHDYAAVATESEVWNGYKNTGKWNVIDRMWSNTIKMWNSDVDNSVTYDTYENVRNTFGYFPGYTSCSSKANLSLATDISKIVIADHAALESALSDKVTNDDGRYTENSYSAYMDAYTKAEAVNQDRSATQTEIDNAVNALTNAKNALIDLSALKAALGNKLSNTDGKYTQGSFQAYENAYANAEAVLQNAASSSEMIASAIEELNAAETALVDRSALTIALADYKITNPDSNGVVYTAESFKAYEEAYSNAENVNADANATAEAIANAVTALKNAKEDLKKEEINGSLDFSALNVAIKESMSFDRTKYVYLTWHDFEKACNALEGEFISQSAINAAVEAYYSTRNALVEFDHADEDDFKGVTTMSGTARYGRKWGIKIYTGKFAGTSFGANKKLVITHNGEIVTEGITFSSKLQQLKTGEIIRYWMVYITPYVKNTDGSDVIYELHTETDDYTISVTVK